MVLPFLLPALLSTAAAVGTTVLSNRAASQQQRSSHAFTAAESAASRQFAFDQYHRERRHSIEDYTRSLNAQYGPGSARTRIFPGGSRGVAFGGELGSKGADLIGRDRDLDYSGRHLQQVFDVGKAQGLTPQEIVGSPAAGGTSRSGGNQVLGQSQASADAALSQARQSAEQRRTALELEAIRAATAVRVAQIQSGTAHKTAGLSAGANILGSGLSSASQVYAASQGAETSRRGQDIQAQTARAGQSVQLKVAQIAAEAGTYNTKQITAAQRDVARIQQSTALAQLAQKRLVDAAQIDSIAAQTALTLQESAIKSQLHSERWAKLFSTMGPENVMASALAVVHGVPLEDVLNGVELSDATRLRLREFINEVIGGNSELNRNIQGLGTSGHSIYRGVLGP